MTSPATMRLLLPIAAALLAASGCTPKAGSAADSTGATRDTVNAAATGDAAAATPTASNVSLPVSALPVRTGDLVLSVSTTGQVRSDGEATLKAEVAGTVDKIIVHPGDRVKKGALLLRFDPRPFDLAVDEAVAAEAEAEVRFRDATVPDSVVTGKGPTPELRRIAMTRSGLQTARVRLERARLDRERAALLAPFDGMVDRIDVAPGERVQGGESLLRIVNLGELRIEAAVLEHDLALIKEGGQALVSSAAAPDRQVTGKVTAILPVIDTVTRAGRAYIRVPGGSYLRPGMYADVRLEATRLANRRLVPARAIIERDGRPLVFVVKEGRAKWTYITPGRSNGNETEVLPDTASGQIPIEVGDLVIVDGHLTLTHDAPVRVLEPAPGARDATAGKTVPVRKP